MLFSDGQAKKANEWMFEIKFEDEDYDVKITLKDNVFHVSKMIY